MKTGADGTLRHDDDSLFEPLLVQFVEGDEHQRPAFSRCRRRFDKQILLAPFRIGELLHRPHAKGIGFGRTAVTGVGDRDGGDG